MRRRRGGDRRGSVRIARSLSRAVGSEWPMRRTARRPIVGAGGRSRVWPLAADDLERDAMFGGRCCGLLACTPLIDEGDLDALGGLRLNGLGDLADFGAIVGVGGRDVKNQKMSKRVDRQMQLRALLSLCAVVGCARPTFRRRAQGSAVDDGDGRLRGTS